MVDLDEFTVTDATLEQMAGTANPRLKQIMEAAVRHMHAFVREVELTPAEWIQGLQFLTAVGQKFTALGDTYKDNTLHKATSGEPYCPSPPSDEEVTPGTTVPKLQAHESWLPRPRLAIALCLVGLSV